ncbi:MAG: FUN14 domain-containing protein [Candidatus Dependentiae bacterium]|nr:FUN14 domain-containing protein [Candidatus Dependentiae bacterium]
MKQASELWERVRSAFAGYPAWVSEGLVGLFAGLIVGFLCRILGRTALIIVIAGAVLGFGLHYFGIVTFNTEPVLKFFGMAQWPSLSQGITNLFEWCKEHLVATVALIFGFLLGWKLGS